MPPWYHPACRAVSQSGIHLRSQATSRPLSIALTGEPVASYFPLEVFTDEEVLGRQDRRRVQSRSILDLCSAGTLPGSHLAFPARWQMAYYSCFLFMVSGN